MQIKPLEIPFANYVRGVPLTSPPGPSPSGEGWFRPPLTVSHIAVGGLLPHLGEAGRGYQGQKWKNKHAKLEEWVRLKKSKLTIFLLVTHWQSNIGFNENHFFKRTQELTFKRRGRNTAGKSWGDDGSRVSTADVIVNLLRRRAAPLRNIKRPPRERGDRLKYVWKK